MSLQQPTTSKRGPWLLTAAVVWVLILFLKSIEPAPAVTPKLPVVEVASAPLTTTTGITATTSLTATAPGTTTIAAATTASAISPTTATTTVSDKLSASASKGKAIFATTCAACHGPNGEGVKGLGKDMTTSQFIAGLSDSDLLAFIKVGRATGDPLNTTGVMMPPKGGNPTLDDAKLLDIIAFMRSLQKPATPVSAGVTTSQTVTTTALVTTAATTDTASSALSPTSAAPAPPVELTGAAATGKVLFATTCAACHGPNGEGVKGLGKDMTTSEFIAGLSDPDLLAFIKQGRAPGDALNTTGIMMPPKGGNPTLDDAKLLEIIAFIRAIQKR